MHVGEGAAVVGDPAAFQILSPRSLFLLFVWRSISLMGTFALQRGTVGRQAMETAVFSPLPTQRVTMGFRVSHPEMTAPRGGPFI